MSEVRTRGDAEELRTRAEAAETELRGANAEIDQLREDVARLREELDEARATLSTIADWRYDHRLTGQALGYEGPRDVARAFLAQDTP